MMIKFMERFKARIEIRINVVPVVLLYQWPIYEQNVKNDKTVDLI